VIVSLKAGAALARVMVSAGRRPAEIVDEISQSRGGGQA
jgi:hypothetical protein